MKNLKKNKFETIKVFLEVRMLKIFLLGIISGFPWVLIGSSLSLWLKEEGLSRSAIGWAGAIFAVYAINYLWAPLVDKLKISWLTQKIGHRKSVQNSKGQCLVMAKKLGRVLSYMAHLNNSQISQSRRVRFHSN